MSTGQLRAGAVAGGPTGEGVGVGVGVGVGIGVSSEPQPASADSSSAMHSSAKAELENADERLAKTPLLLPPIRLLSRAGRAGQLKPSATTDLPGQRVNSP